MEPFHSFPVGPAEATDVPTDRHPLSPSFSDSLLGHSLPLLPQILGQRHPGRCPQTRRWVVGSVAGVAPRALIFFLGASGFGNHLRGSLLKTAP